MRATALVPRFDHQMVGWLAQAHDDELGQLEPEEVGAVMRMVGPDHALDHGCVQHLDRALAGFEKCGRALGVIA